jgi:hypothetical protein
MFVSLLSSRRDQVVPNRYCRQENCLPSKIKRYFKPLQPTGLVNFEVTQELVFSLNDSSLSNRLLSIRCHSPKYLRLYGQDNQPISTS